MRRWLVVIDDKDSEFTEPDELESFITNLFAGTYLHGKIARVQRGGLLADKVMQELPPVRHRDMGRARG